MKKKVLFLALTAALMLSACSKEAESTDVESDVAVEAEVEVEEETEAEVEEAEIEEETEVVEEEETEETEEAVSDYVKGTVTETGWESEWIGIRYTAPEGMTMSTEEELDEVMGIGEEALADDYTEAQLAYAEMSSVYEMMSTDELGITNVVISAEKLSFDMDKETYTNLLIQSLTSISAADYEVVKQDEVVTVGSRDFIKTSFEANYDGVIMCQDYYVTVIDDRAVSFIITYMNDTVDLAEAIFNAFEAY